tara:strand:- start:195 stop:1301 length:1107 start_codon:yes stop_codon:yes gene_type:complete
MGTSMAYTVREISQALSASFEGDAEIVVTGVSEPAMSDVGDIALAMKPDYAESLNEGRARVAILWEGADWQSYGLDAAIFAPRPRFALAGLSKVMDDGQSYEKGIHPNAFVHPTAKLGSNLTIGAFSYISAYAEIADDSVIAPQVYIGVNAYIGPNALVREGVKIGANVQIGARFIAQPGVVVGSDGFSFVTEEVSAVENARKTLGDQLDAHGDQTWTRIHSLGSVLIGDDVEIGANSCIDSGTVRATQIGNGVKMDNLVHIGHNVVVGDHCLFCGQVGIAGSSKLGKNVVLAGQTGVNDNIFIGDNVIAGGASKIFTNVPAGRVILGYPAVKMQNHVDSYKALRRLPRMFKEVAELKKIVFKTEGSK